MVSAFSETQRPFRLGDVFGGNGPHLQGLDKNHDPAWRDDPDATLIWLESLRRAGAQYFTAAVREQRTHSDARPLRACAAQNGSTVNISVLVWHSFRARGRTCRFGC